VVTAETREKVTAAFRKAVNEVKCAHEMPLGASGASWATFNIPVSAEPILNLGPGAIPVLDDFRKIHDWRTAMLADACVSILEAKRVTRQGTFRSQVGGVEFVTYSVTE